MSQVVQSDAPPGSAENGGAAQGSFAAPQPGEVDSAAQRAAVSRDARASGRRPTPELLAPAGDWEAMRAAVANGADAVYFGVGGLNARHRAANFAAGELPEVMAFLHGHNVRGYVTINVLIFSDELSEVVELIRQIAAAGVDAVILQDLGLVALVRRLCPTLAVHGSTQMTLTEPLGIEFVRALGVERVILARELSTNDVRKIVDQTPMPVEVFVHGALCVSYSGQCLTSESLGGRSANRGQCAQACRLPYSLIVDGAVRDIGDKAYLLSPQDLAAYDLIDDLAQLGVTSVKIEGRLKSPQYVAATTQTYRAAIDASAKAAEAIEATEAETRRASDKFAGRTPAAPAPAKKRFTLTRQQEMELAQSFSRGFTHGFLDGVDHRTLVHARFPKSRGICVGVVVGTTASGVLIDTAGRAPSAVPAPRGTTAAHATRASTQLPRGQNVARSNANFKGSLPTSSTQASPAPALIKPGDGLVFDEGHPEQDEQGGRVFAVRPASPSPSLKDRPASRQGDQIRGRVGDRDERGVGDGRSVISPRGPSTVFEISFGHGAVNVSAVSIGSLVWKTDDPEIRRRLEQSYNRPTIAKREPVTADVVAKIGGRLSVTLRDAAGRSATASWDKPLERAQKFPLTMDLLREQFGRLGDTPYELGEIRVNGAGNGAVDGAVDCAMGGGGDGGAFPAAIEPVMVPKSVLNDLRRQATAELLKLRDATCVHEIVEPDALETIRSEIDEREYPTLRPGNGVLVTDGSDGVGPTALDSNSPASNSPASNSRASGSAASNFAASSATSADRPRLYALVRTMEQLQAAIDFAPADGPRVSMVYCEFEDVRKYPQAVAAARAAGVPVGLATLRVIKPGEDGLLSQIGAAAPDAALVRNLAGIAFFASRYPGLPLIGDYALNISNEITADLFAARGVARMVPSYDLNWKQLKAMLARFDARRFEQVIHQHMPMFHMEHCVFCHTLSTGKDHRDCGRPCDRHRVDLGDRANVNHPLLADVGCRNTVYNGTAQSAAEFVPEMIAQGLRHFRVELLRETAEQTTQMLGRYARVLSGKEDGRTTWQGLKVLNQLGVVRGTLERLE